MSNILRQDFFNRDTKVVAQELLGKFLVRKINGREVVAIITDVEVYDGPHDKASHASKGRTKRTEVMFGEAGKLYVYLCYGIHHMLNVVTREHGYPAAILIRGVENFDGPGKVTKHFYIDKNLNGKPAEKGNGLWFEDRSSAMSDIASLKIKKLSRVGVDYAGPIWSKKKLRFKLK